MKTEKLDILNRMIVEKKDEKRELYAILKDTPSCENQFKLTIAFLDGTIQGMLKSRKLLETKVCSKL